MQNSDPIEQLYPTIPPPPPPPPNNKSRPPFATIIAVLAVLALIAVLFFSCNPLHKSTVGGSVGAVIPTVMKSITPSMPTNATTTTPGLSGTPAATAQAGATASPTSPASQTATITPTSTSTPTSGGSGSIVQVIVTPAITINITCGSGSQTTITITNPGSVATPWNVTIQIGTFTLSPPSGILQPAGSQVIQITKILVGGTMLLTNGSYTQTITIICV